MPELRQPFSRLLSGQPFWIAGPLLTLEHTGVALASAACLREGSCGTYAVVPVLMPGSLTKCLNWGNLFLDSCQVNLLNWWAPSDSRTHWCGSSVCCVSPWGLTVAPMLRCRFYCLVAWLNACIEAISSTSPVRSTFCQSIGPSSWSPTKV